MVIFKKRSVFILILFLLICISVYFYFANGALYDESKKQPHLNPDCMLQDTEFNRFNIASLQDKLIFVFSEYGCTSCVYEHLDQLKLIEDKLDNSKIVIVGYFLNQRNYIVFNTTKKLIFPVYFAESNIFTNKETEQSFSPFFIRIEHNEITLYRDCIRGYNDTYSFLNNYFRLK